MTVRQAVLASRRFTALPKQLMKHLSNLELATLRHTTEECVQTVFGYLAAAPRRGARLARRGLSPAAPLADERVEHDVHFALLCSSPRAVASAGFMSTKGEVSSHETDATGTDGRVASLAPV